MGVVQRQSIKGSIVAYIGVLLGAFNTIIVYPLALSQIEIGLVQNIISKATILSSLLQLGAGSIAIKYYGLFKDETHSRKGFLLLVLIFPVLGFLLSLLIVWLFQGRYHAYLAAQPEDVARYFYLVLPLGFIMALNFVLTTYPKNFFRIVLPTLLDQVAVKIGLASMALLYYAHWITQGAMLHGMTLAYTIPCIGLLWYIYHNDHFALHLPVKKLDPPMVRNMLVFAFFMWIGSISANIRVNLASATLNDFIGEGGLVSLSIFSVAFYIGTAISIPGKSIEAILSPFTAKAILEQDDKTILELYQKSALHQFMAGCFVYGIIVICLSEIFAIMPNGARFSSGAMAIVILGMGSLVDLATGINSQILSLSKYYRYDLVFAILMGMVNIVLLYVLVSWMRYGIMGAAWANFLSLLFFNLLKLYFIQSRMGMWPFTRKMAWIIPAAFAAGFAGYLMDFSWHPVLGILAKSLVFSSIFLYLVIKLRVSAEVNDLFFKLVSKITNISKK